jgi:hypothetical protein
MGPPIMPSRSDAPAPPSRTGRLRWALAVVTALVCVEEAGILVGGARRPIVLARADAAPAEADNGAGLEPAFAQHMTPDDVARGVWGLTRVGGPDLDRAGRPDLGKPSSGPVRPTGPTEAGTAAVVSGALTRVSAADVALGADQRGALGALLADGARIRGELGELRTKRRAQVTTLLRDDAAIVDAIGADRARGLAPRSGTGR